jgi:hypothetical protein
MPESIQTAEILEQLLSHIEEQTELLRSRLSDQVRTALSSMQPAPVGKDQVAPGTGPTDILFAAVASIYDASTQADILKSFLDGVSHFSSRCALFVVKGNKIVFWQGRGFENGEALKGLALDATKGLAGRALQDRCAASAAAVEFDPDLVAAHGNPADGNATVSPLIVRDKVAAVVYTDCGTAPGASADPSAVQVLVRTASSWLEISAARKAAPMVAEPEFQSTEFASAAAAATVASPPTAPPVPASAPAPAPAAEEPVAATAASSSFSPEEQALHTKAKRFAKLLVDEIKLYNQAKVAEGRQNRDLYRRLREDIDKSRATYDKRYAATSVADARYFDQELVRILADNDPTLLGSDFPQ